VPHRRLQIISLALRIIAPAMYRIRVFHPKHYFKACETVSSVAMIAGGFGSFWRKILDLMNQGSQTVSSWPMNFLVGTWKTSVVKLLAHVHHGEIMRSEGTYDQFPLG
jgi:hypothetical protein